MQVFGNANGLFIRKPISKTVQEALHTSISVKCFSLIKKGYRERKRGEDLEMIWKRLGKQIKPIGKDQERIGKR
jgi:hypothetical protein